MNDEILFAPIVEAIKKNTGLPAYVESTGGNVRTIYVGNPNADGYYPLAVGPGVWEDGIGDVGYLGDLYWGPDDGGDFHGEEQSATQSDTQETVTSRILQWIDRWIVVSTCTECAKPLPANWPFPTCGSHDPQPKDVPCGDE